VKNGWVTLTQDWTTARGLGFPAGLIGYYKKYNGREWVKFLGHHDQPIKPEDPVPSLLPILKAQGMIAEHEFEMEKDIKRINDLLAVLREKLLTSNPLSWDFKRAEQYIKDYESYEDEMRNWHHFISVKLLTLDRHFEVSTCYLHKGKLGFRIPKDVSRRDLINMLIDELGTDWSELTFKKVGTIRWLQVS